MDNNEILSLVRQAIGELEQAKGQIKSAGNWGLWDMLGGGFWTTLIKHGKLDNAKDCIARANRTLQMLADELRAAGLDASLDDHIGDFARFADFFMDGLWTDLYMQSKIKEFGYAVDERLRALRQLENILTK